MTEVLDSRGQAPAARLRDRLEEGKFEPLSDLCTMSRGDEKNHPPVSCACKVLLRLRPSEETERGDEGPLTIGPGKLLPTMSIKQTIIQMCPQKRVWNTQSKNLLEFIVPDRIFTRIYVRMFVRVHSFVCRGKECHRGRWSSMPCIQYGWSLSSECYAGGCIQCSQGKYRVRFGRFQLHCACLWPDCECVLSCEKAEAWMCALCVLAFPPDQVLAHP